MSRKIAVLRGINVGGKRKILMSELKSMCEKLELQNVKTYIQSGNLIFNSDKPSSELELDIEKTITKKIGFDVPVIVRTEEELKNSINNNPFFDENTDINQLHLTFFKARPNKQDIENMLALNCEPDKFKVEDKSVFIFCSGKYYESKLTNNFFEKRLKVSATTRNWKTVLKLLELS